METEYLTKDTSSLKLLKMTKSYNWEIKIFHDDLEEMKKKIKELDDWCQANYGSLE